MYTDANDLYHQATSRQLSKRHAHILHVKTYAYTYVVVYKYFFTYIEIPFSKSRELTLRPVRACEHSH